MFRRSALSATASLAVVLLAVTGCKVQVSAAGKTGWVFESALSATKVSGDMNLMPGAAARSGPRQHRQPERAEPGQPGHI